MMRKLNLMVIILLAILLTGCGGNGDVTPPPPTVPPVEVIPTDTPTPSEPAPVAPGVVVLVAPVDADPVKIQELEAVAGAAASARGLIFEKREGIDPQTAPETLVMVLAAADFLGLSAMADALPEVQFVVAGASTLEAKQNLAAMGAGGDLSLTQAFMAGYIAAVQSEEYRVGIIGVNDPAGREYREAFLNGAIYFCGACNTIYPPFETYPAYVEVPVGADQATLENAARTLIGKGVNMMLVAPDLQDAAFYQFLAQNGVRIVGTDAPPAGLESHWVASVLLTSGVSLDALLAAVLDGGNIPISGSKMEVSYTGAGDARLAHFAQILAQLDSGAIDPLGKVD